TLERAAEALEEIWSAQKEWTALANLQGLRLQRLGPICKSGQEELHARLWLKLGELGLHHLRERDNALAALEVASRFDPANLPLHRLLASLYLEVNPAQPQKAIEELHRVLAADPGAAREYQLLEELYGHIDQPAKAAACARARELLERRQT